MNPSWFKVLVPLGVLGASAAGTWWMLQHPATPQEQPAAITLPRVRVQTALPQSVTLTVHSQGVVTPRVEIELVTQGAGTVTAVHPALSDAGFFKKGGILVRLDPRDYDTALVEAEAQVAEARKTWLREATEAEQAKIDWQALGQGQPSPYVLHLPQRDAAKAQLAAAEARLTLARSNCERTALRAPFEGRVRESKGIAPGQYLGAGVSVARIYPTDRVRVRLPLKDSELAYVDLPLGYRDAGTEGGDPPITLHAEFAGQTATWPARITTLEDAIDEKTRLVHALAEVSDPFGKGAVPERPPLNIGQFVEADIQRLRFRAVEILPHERERVLLRGGLAAGERVVVSPLEDAVEGLQVKVEAGP